MELEKLEAEIKSLAERVNRLEKEQHYLLSKLENSPTVAYKPRPRESTDQARYPLRGKVVYYENPTEPVAQEDWDALR